MKYDELWMRQLLYWTNDNVLDALGYAVGARRKKVENNDDAIDAEFKRVEDEPLLLEDHNKETTK